MNRFLALAVASIFLLAPAAALAHPVGDSAHVRPQLFHDRSPRPHVHTVSMHH